MVKTKYLWTASNPAYGLVNGEDILPDLAIGRLPAANRIEKIYLSRLGVSATRYAILDAFDQGASIVSYVGHGAIHLWADEDLLIIWDVGDLSPQSRQPLLLTMNCLNGYFHFPYFNSLSEELVKAEGKGAIAAITPSGLSLNGAAHLLHKDLLNELQYAGHDRLGDAVLAAQSAYAETGAFPELLSIYHLLGDPAMMLRYDFRASLSGRHILSSSKQAQVCLRDRGWPRNLKG